MEEILLQLPLGMRIQLLYIQKNCEWKIFISFDGGFYLSIVNSLDSALTSRSARYIKAIWNIFVHKSPPLQILSYKNCEKESFNEF